MFIAKPGKVYNLTKTLGFLNTAAMLNRNAEIETRLWNSKLVTIQFDASTNDVTLIAGLGNGNERSYSYRLAIGQEEFVDIIMYLDRCHDDDQREFDSETETESNQQVAQASESLWW
jgi:hypothetical protein